MTAARTIAELLVHDADLEQYDTIPYPEVVAKRDPGVRWKSWRLGGITLCVFRPAETTTETEGGDA